MKSMTILITLTTLIFITGAEESTTSPPDMATFGNEIIINETDYETHAPSVCDTLFTCPGVDYDVLTPKGTLTKGFYFPSTYPATLCKTIRKLESCISRNPALNNVQCEVERNFFYFITKVNAEFCSPSGRNDMEELRKCANNKEVQLYLYGIQMAFYGSMTTIRNLNSNLNLDPPLVGVKEISRQLQCSAVDRFALEAKWNVIDNCGSNIAIPFEKLAKMYIEFGLTNSPYGLCPVVLTELFQYGMDNSIPGRKKRSLNGFIRVIY